MKVGDFRMSMALIRAFMVGLRGRGREAYVIFSGKFSRKANYRKGMVSLNCGAVRPRHDLT